MANAPLPSKLSKIASPSLNAVTSVNSQLYLCVDPAKGLTLINGVNGVNFKVDRDTVDATSWGDLFKVYLAGRIDAGVSFTVKYIAGDEASSKLCTDIFYSGKAIPMAVVINKLDENSEVYLAWMLVTSASPSFGDGDVITYNVEAKITGELTRDTLKNVKTQLHDTATTGPAA